MLKNSPRVANLALYDIANAPGVAADLSHIDTRAIVTHHTSEAELADALKGADVVVIPAGVPRKPGTHLTFLPDYSACCTQFDFHLEQS